jgi:hypothetical protein
MADTVTKIQACSDNEPRFLGDKSDISCANCESVKEQLREALLELKSARLIKALLQDDVDNVPAPGTSNAKPPHNSEPRTQDRKSDLMPVIYSSSRRPNGHLTPFTANRFEVLANLIEEHVISNTSHRGKITSKVSCRPIE